jgi:butyrate kinase
MKVNCGLKRHSIIEKLNAQLRQSVKRVQRCVFRCGMIRWIEENSTILTQKIVQQLSEQGGRDDNGRQGIYTNNASNTKPINSKFTYVGDPVSIGFLFWICFVAGVHDMEG